MPVCLRWLAACVVLVLLLGTGSVQGGNREDGQKAKARAKKDGQKQTGQHEDEDRPAKAQGKKKGEDDEHKGEGKARTGKGKKGEDDDEREERASKAKGKKKEGDRDERDGRNHQSGFQGEQRGEHDDAKPAKGKTQTKGRENAGGKQSIRESHSTDRTAELERRLDRLLTELEALRRELRKK